MTRLLSAILFLLLVPVSSWAACSGSSPSWTAASCSTADVQACIDEVGVQDGDVINVPAGSCALASDIALDKNVTLKGAGNDPAGTVLTTNGITVTAVAAAGKYPIISDFRFNCQGMGVSGSVYLNATTTQFRITNNVFLGSTTSTDRCVAIGDRSTTRPIGVIDNNAFTGSTVFSAVLVQADNGYTARTLGDPDAVYIENNTFTSTATGDGVIYVDGDYGSNTVVRYNNIINGGGITIHGANEYDPADRMPMITWELYNNAVSLDTGSRYWNFHLRGGTGVVFNNSVSVGIGSTITRGLSLIEYRSSVVRPTNDGCEGATNACDGNHAYDGNTVYASGTSGTGGTTTVMNTSGLTPGAHVWQRLYQGANSCLISANTATTVTCTVAMEGGVDWSAATAYEIKTGWPCFGQIGTKPGSTYGTAGFLMDLSPTYVWGNTCTGTVSQGCSGGVLTPIVSTPETTCRVKATPIVLDRDYYVATHPTYTAYTCPHPLVGAGACAPSVAGRSGYVLGGGGSITFGGSGTMTPGAGGTITFE